MDCSEADPPRFTPGASLSSDARPRSASTARGQGRIGAALREPGTVPMKPEPAERAEEWGGGCSAEEQTPSQPC